MLYDRNAKRQTVSLTVNADLFAKVKRAGINASRVAESALAEALAALERERIGAEIRQDLAAADAYAAKHGSFADMVREHYAAEDDGSAV
jgi:post-segregation antitoxin (ccd killing protein)